MFPLVIKNASILIVDDQPANLRLLERLLEQDGYTQVTTTTDSREVLALFAERKPDLILLDLVMPHLDGFGVMEQLRPVISAEEYLPILILTADITPETKRRALASGAKDFLTKPIDAVEVLLRIRNLLETRFLYQQLRNQNQILDEQVRARTAELTQANADLRVEMAERQQAEQASRAAELKYRSLVEHLPIITYIIEFGEVNRTTYISPQVETILGFTPAEWVADPSLWRKQLHPDDRERVLAAFEQADKIQQPANLEYRLLARNGREVWLHGWSVPVPDETGVVRYAHGILMDITERKQAETQITQQLSHISALHDIDQAIASSLDLALTLRIVLATVTAQLGVDAADILLTTPDGFSLAHAAGHGFRTDAIQKSRLRFGESYAGRAALERRLQHAQNLANVGPEFLRARSLQAEGFVDYYAVPLIAKGQVSGVLELFHRRVLQTGTEWLDFLNTLAGQAAIAIDNIRLFEGLEKSNFDLALAYDTTIQGWSRVLDLRDKETEGHSQRVTDFTLKLAAVLGVSSAELVHIQRGALLHDIGKMGIPDSVLLKPGPLTDDEWAIMKQHPALAHAMLLPIQYLRPALDIPYCHHEKWDGTGYPRGLKGEEIPLAARIFAVVDVWDALRSDRPYRAAWPAEKVRAHIAALSGSHFDPQVVDTFLSII